MELTPFLQEGVRAQLGAPPLLEAQVDTEHILFLLQESQSGSMWKLGLSASWVAPSVGSRPGSILAGDVFNLVFSSALREIQERMKAEDLVWQAPPAPHHASRPQDWHDPAADFSFVDDLTILVGGPANTIVHQLSKVFRIIHDSVGKRGLLVNSAKTKTLICFRGPGAKAASRNLFDALPPRIHLPALDARIDVVQVHKILGALVSANGGIGREICARNASMVGALRPIKKVVSPSPLLSMQTKVRYAETLGAIRFLFAAG
eukprot:7318256-Pyramimonas_sp.AAC.1